MARINWHTVAGAAAVWVSGQTVRVTLRQVFYRLVSDEVIPNSVAAYKSLSRVTAEGRRAGTFPALADGTRSIQEATRWESAEHFWRSVIPQFQLDRTEGQEHQVWVVVEKRGLVQQVDAWVGDRGWPIVPLGGYGSQTITDKVAARVGRDARPAVALYIGDYDASGVDIQRDFLGRTGCWDDLIRVALTMDQVIDKDLPLLPGKATDARSAKFAAANGGLFQVEVDALPPNDLRDALMEASDPYWDEVAGDAVLDREDEIREAMRRIVGM